MMPNRQSGFIEGAKIVAFSVFAAVVYGVLHDQVTAHLCVEYFTIAHPPIFPTESPFWLALGWGIIATWWVGLSLGIGLALAAQLGSAPKQAFLTVRRRIVGLMIASAIAAIVAGIGGAALFSSGVVDIPERWELYIPSSRHLVFTAVAWAHLASYAVGLLGGLAVIGLTIRRRFQQV
jgi:hypothetical protein